MITRSNLAEQLREYQLRSKHDWASVSFFSSTSNLSSSRYVWFLLSVFLFNCCWFLCNVNMIHLYHVCCDSFLLMFSNVLACHNQLTLPCFWFFDTVKGENFRYVLDLLIPYIYILFPCLVKDWVFFAWVWAANCVEMEFLLINYMPYGFLFPKLKLRDVSTTFLGF